MTTFGLYLANLIGVHEADEVCASLHLTRMALYRLITGTAKLTPKVADRLHARFGQPASFWLWLAEEH